MNNKSEEEKKAWLVRLMTAHEKSLLRLCCAYLRDSAMAEDAVQECFVRAYRAMDSFRGESSEKTWLCAIAMNVCRNMRRLAWFRYVDRRIDFDKLPLATGAPSDVSMALMSEVMRLPPKYMEAVWLRYYEDLSIAEMASALGISASAVSHRLSRAKEMLKSALEGVNMDE